MILAQAFTSRIFAADKPLRGGYGHLALSPDVRFLLYPQIDQEGSDIVPVEHLLPRLRTKPVCISMVPWLRYISKCLSDLLDYRVASLLLPMEIFSPTSVMIAD